MNPPLRLAVQLSCRLFNSTSANRHVTEAMILVSLISCFALKLFDDHNFESNRHRFAKWR